MTIEDHVGQLSSEPCTLTCACCGTSCLGRQWCGRDTGFGLCPRCVGFVSRLLGTKHLEAYYGLQGVHYNLPLEEVTQWAREHRTII